ncbi:MAG: class I SAM-dependent RNA methyltransferase [Alphaproteobacteria bacterium]|nr:MAG: class I SAM-dependent RNA methyltransferase [Alphaproteobacteria bacterium]
MTRVEGVVVALGSAGDGIVETPAGNFFVPFVLPGERVRLIVSRDRKGRPRVERHELLEPIAERSVPRCRHFGRCGGCALQHLPADSYASWIVRRIETALATQGIEAARVRIARPEISPPGARRRLVLHALKGRDGRLLLGFHGRASHHLIDIETCPLARPALVALLPALRRAMANVLPPRGTADLTLTETGSGIDLLVRAGALPDYGAIEELAKLAEDGGLAAVSWSDGGTPETLVQRCEPVVDFAGVPVTFPSGAFLQATQEGEAALRRAVLEWVGDAPRVIELFSGLGTFGLPLAASRKSVLMAEGDRRLVTAVSGALERSGMQPCARVVHRDLFRRPFRPGELDTFDVMIFDPPRTGAKEQLRELEEARAPRRIIAISCNPNTFARDARILIDKGWQLVEIRPVDQFLWSPHLELAALFEMTGGVR